MARTPIGDLYKDFKLKIIDCLEAFVKTHVRLRPLLNANPVPNPDRPAGAGLAGLFND